jgi:hypothetical protein
MEAVCVEGQFHLFRSFVRLRDVLRSGTRETLARGIVGNANTRQRGASDG